jgi:hypothetical protein
MTSAGQAAGDAKGLGGTVSNTLGGHTSPTATGPTKPPTSNPADQLGSQFLDPTGYFAQAQASLDKQQAQAKISGADQIAANQRRAATLAALSGRGLGGGFAQALNQGTISGQNAMQNELNQIEGQRQAIYGQEASEAFQNQQNNKNNAFQLGLHTADNTAQTNSLQFSGDKQNALSGLQSLSGMDMDPTGASRAAGSTVAGITNEINSATTSAQLAAAVAHRDRFLAALNSLRAQWKQGKDTSKGSWQDMVNKAEQAGQFK